MTTHSQFLGNPCTPFFKLFFCFSYAINVINVFHNVKLTSIQSTQKKQEIARKLETRRKLKMEYLRLERKGNQV